MGIKLNEPNTAQIQHSDLKTIAKGAGIVFSGTVIGTGLRYLFELIAARKLGTNLFGLFFLGFAVLKISEILSTLGLHRGVLRYIAIFQGEKDDQQTKGAIIFSIKATVLAGLLLSIGLILLSKFFALHVFHNIDMVNVLRFFALAIPLTAVTTILVFSTQGFKVMRYRVYVREISEPAARIIILLIALILGWRLFGAIFAFVTSFVMGTILAFFYLRRVYPALSQKDVIPVYKNRKILGFSWPLLLAEFFSLISIWINILMIGFFLTSYQVGIYSAAHRTALLGQIIFISFNAIFSPIIADLYNREELKKLEHLFKIVIKWIFTFSFPICLIMIICSSEILHLFGKNFMQGAICLILLSSAQLINSVFGSSGFLIMMSGKSKINLLNNIIVVSLNIGLNIFLIPKYGIVGAALSFFISASFINIIMFLEIYMLFKFFPFRGDLYKSFVAGSASFIIVYIVVKNVLFITSPLIHIFFSSFCFFLLYALLIYLQRLDDEDILILNMIKTKLSIFNR